MTRFEPSLVQIGSSDAPCNSIGYTQAFLIGENMGNFGGCQLHHRTSQENSTGKKHPFGLSATTRNNWKYYATLPVGCRNAPTFKGYLHPKTSKFNGVKQVPDIDHPTAQGTHYRKILFTPCGHTQTPGRFSTLVSFCTTQAYGEELCGVKVTQFSHLGLFFPYKISKKYLTVTNHPGLWLVSGRYTF